MTTTASPGVPQKLTEFAVDSIPLPRENKDLLRAAIEQSFAPGGAVDQCMPTLLNELGVP